MARKERWLLAALLASPATIVLPLGVFALLGIGIALLIAGYNATSSVADQLSNAFTGRYTQGTSWYLIGGGAATATGAIRERRPT